jgi:FHA domain
MVTISHKSGEGGRFKMYVNSKGIEGRSNKMKSYWNNKIYIGRNLRNFENKEISYLDSMNSETSLSKKHCVIDFSRAFNTYEIPYKFLNFLMCIKHNNMFIPEDILKYIYQYIKKPKYINPNVCNYIRIQDLGSKFGTNIKIKEVELKSCTKFYMADVLITIETVRNYSILHQNHFFRGIDSSYIVKIDMSYMENVYNDMELEGECGYPHVKCKINDTKYILIATKNKYTFLLGRNGECDIFTSNDQISRTQCTIIYDIPNKIWRLRDGGDRPSTNGTYQKLKNPQNGKKSEWALLQEPEILVSSYKVVIDRLKY